MKKYGIILLLICGINACTEPQPDTDKYKYNVKNHYSSTINIACINYFNQTYTITILPDSVYSEIEYAESPTTSFSTCTSLTVHYSDRQATFVSNDTSSRNPILGKNYVGREISPGYYEYTFTITEQDYLDAEPIK